MAGLRVLGRALTTTPVLGLSVLPPPRLSLSLIAQPCSYATAPRLILPLLGTDHIGSGPLRESFVYDRPGRHPRRCHQRFALPLGFGKRHGRAKTFRPISLRPMRLPDASPVQPA